MEIHVIEHDKTIIVYVTGKLDVRNSPELEKVISCNIKKKIVMP